MVGGIEMLDASRPTDSLTNEESKADGGNC